MMVSSYMDFTICISRHVPSPSSHVTSAGHLFFPAIMKKEKRDVLDNHMDITVRVGNYGQNSWNPICETFSSPVPDFITTECKHNLGLCGKYVSVGAHVNDQRQKLGGEHMHVCELRILTGKLNKANNN